MTDSTHPSGRTTCLGSTCRKWGADTKLTALDLSLVMDAWRRWTRRWQPCISTLPSVQPMRQWDSEGRAIC